MGSARRDRIDRRRRTGLCWRPNPRTPRKGHDEHFAGQTCLDHGASSGIGSATARVLSAAGAEVVLSARRADKIEALAEEIRTRGRVGLVRPLDVTDKAASERIGRELAGAGGIHVLVNNAGVMPLSPVLEDRVHE